MGTNVSLERGEKRLETIVSLERYENNVVVQNRMPVLNVIRVERNDALHNRQKCLAANEQGYTSVGEEITEKHCEARLGEEITEPSAQVGRRDVEQHSRRLVVVA